MRETADKNRPGRYPAAIPGAPSHATDISGQGIRNLRNLMALAAALRRLALDSGPREATLYLSAATLLHRRAASLAGLRPREPDPQGPSQRPATRKRIDIRI